jgi:hypothetical protein
MKYIFFYLDCLILCPDTVLTDSGLSNNPGQAQKQHNTPDVEKTGDEHPLDPSQLDAMSFVCRFRAPLFDVAILSEQTDPQ